MAAGGSGNQQGLAGGGRSVGSHAGVGRSGEGGFGAYGSPGGPGYQAPSPARMRAKVMMPPVRDISPPQWWRMPFQGAGGPQMPGTVRTPFRF
jgi:hypothetical protein